MSRPSTSATGPSPRPRPPAWRDLPIHLANEAPRWPRHHVGEPERDDRVQVEEAIRDPGQGEHDREHHAGRQEAHPRRVGGKVAGGRSHREGREHGGPVEKLAPAGVDAVDRECPLAPVPGSENDRQRNGEEDGRDDVRHVELDVQHVGGHRPEDRDHEHRQARYAHGTYSVIRSWIAIAMTKATNPPNTSMRCTGCTRARGSPGSPSPMAVVRILMIQKSAATSGTLTTIERAGAGMSSPVERTEPDAADDGERRMRRG